MNKPNQVAPRTRTNPDLIYRDVYLCIQILARENKQATAKELDQLCKTKNSDSTAQLLSNQEEILLFLVEQSQQLHELKEQQAQSYNMIKTLTNKINELTVKTKSSRKK